MWGGKFLRYLATATAGMIALLLISWYSTPYWVPTALKTIASHYHVQLIDLQSSPPTLEKWEIQHAVLQLPSQQRLIASDVTLALTDFNVDSPSISISISKLLFAWSETKASDDSSTENQPFLLQTLLSKLQLPEFVSHLKIHELSSDYQGASAKGMFEVATIKQTEQTATKVHFIGDAVTKLVNGATAVEITATNFNDSIALALDIGGVDVNSTLTKDGEKWLLSGDFEISKSSANNYLNVALSRFNSDQQVNAWLQSVSIDRDLSGILTGHLPNNLKNRDELTLTIAPTLAASATSEAHGMFAFEGAFNLNLSSIENEPVVEITSQPWNVQINPKSNDLSWLPSSWVLTPLNRIRCTLSAQMETCLNQKTLSLGIHTAEAIHPVSITPAFIISKAVGSISYAITEKRGEANVDFTMLGDGIKVPKSLDIASTFKYEKNFEGWLLKSPLTKVKAGEIEIDTHKINVLTAMLTDTMIVLNAEDSSKSSMHTKIEADTSIQPLTMEESAKHLQWPIHLKVKTGVRLTEKDIRIGQSSLMALGTTLRFEGQLIKKNASIAKSKRPENWRNHEGSMLLSADITHNNAALEKIAKSLIKHLSPQKEITLKQGVVVAKGSLDWKFQDEKLIYSAQLASNASDWDFNIDKTKLKGVGLTTAVFMNNEMYQLTNPIEISVAEIDLGVPIRDIRAHISGSGQIGGDGHCELNLNKAQGSLFGGYFRLARAFKYDCAAYKAKVFRQTAYVEINRLNLENLVKLENENIVAKGEISGLVPVTLTNEKVFVSGGQVGAINPGYIKLLEGESWKSIASGNEQFLFAINALEDFHYNSLVSKVDYLENDQLTLGITLQGSNPKVRNGKEIIYNLNIETNILSLLKSIELADEITEKLSKEYR